MTNHRTKVREALAMMLKGQTIAGDKVFTNRARPIIEADMPAVLIYTAGSSRRPNKDHDGSMLARQMEVIVEAALAGSGHAENLETDLEDFADQIEQLIEADRSILQTAENASWQESQIDIVGDGRKLFGVVRIVYNVDMYSHHDAEASWLATGITATPSELAIIDPEGPGTYHTNSPTKPVSPLPPATGLGPQSFLHGAGTDDQ